MTHVTCQKRGQEMQRKREAEMQIANNKTYLLRRSRHQTLQLERSQVRSSHLPLSSDKSAVTISRPSQQGYGPATLTSPQKCCSQYLPYHPRVTQISLWLWRKFCHLSFIFYFEISFHLIFVRNNFQIRVSVVRQ